MKEKILQKKIIMEKPPGIQRKIQTFVFWCQNIGNNPKHKHKHKHKHSKVVIAPYKEDIKDVESPNI